MIHLFFTLVFILTSLLSKPAIAQNSASQDTLQLTELACLAYNPATFKACINEVLTTGTPIIKITAPIICEGRNDCTFEIKNINTNIIILSSNPKNKFIRKNDFGYSLLTIDNSSGIKLQDLGFKDDSSVPCPAGTICPPLLMITNSSNIQIEKSGFYNTRGTSIKITQPRNLEIVNSRFTNSSSRAVEISSKSFTDGIIIERNIFEGNAGSALIFQAAGLNAAPSSISFNQFLNNHSKGVYLNCIYPCTGSQVQVLGPTANLNFKQNKISGGVNTLFDTLGLYSSGIEIGGSNINNVALFCNEISGNRGSAIVQSPPFRNISGITVSENKLWGNGLNLNIPTASIDENNCYTAECKLACASS